MPVNEMELRNLIKQLGDAEKLGAKLHNHLTTMQIGLDADLDARDFLVEAATCRGEAKALLDWFEAYGDYVKKQSKGAFSQRHSGTPIPGLAGMLKGEVQKLHRQLSQLSLDLENVHRRTLQKMNDVQRTSGPGAAEWTDWLDLLIKLIEKIRGKK